MHSVAIVSAARLALIVKDQLDDRGLSWESFIIDQLISVFHELMPGRQAYVWRTARG